MVLIIRAPSIFPFFWKIVSPWLDEFTRSKVISPRRVSVLHMCRRFFVLVVNNHIMFEFSCTVEFT